MGSDVYTSYGKQYVTTSVIYVDSNGAIKSCFIDSTYVQNNINTTNKINAILLAKFTVYPIPLLFSIIKAGSFLL